MNKKIRYIFIIVMFLAVPVKAQTGDYIHEYNPWPVTNASGLIDIPFWGGINNPKPTFVDFDGDSLVDLFIGDVSGYLGYFHNIGTVSSPVYEAVTNRFADIDIATWHYFADIDADGDFDLFCDSRIGGTHYYENQSTVNSVVFVLQDTAFGSFNTGFNNSPEFVDLDNDNDYDFFIGGLAGNLEFYKNIGDSANPQFQFENSSYDSILAFPGGGFSPPSGSPQNPNHGFSAIRFVDIDNDDDFDLFWGDINNPHLYYFANNGSVDTSLLTYVTEDYLPDVFVGFNHTTFTDIDNDNDIDLLLGVSTEINNMQLFINNGTPESPLLEVVDSNYLNIIDVGGSSRLAFGDIDNDKDLDFFVGGSNGSLMLFTNTGSKSDPQFDLTDSAFGGISVGAFSSPVLVDWDDDTDLDMLIGNQAGRIEYWRNDGDINNFSLVKIESQVGGIQVDQLAIPFPVDLNDDDRLDLIVGEWDFNGFANIRLYENTSLTGKPVLSLVTTSLIPRATRELTLPTFYDYNNDGKMDLVLGGRSEGIELFLNNTALGSFPDSTTLILQTDTLPGYYDGRRIFVSFVDIDGDDDDDIFTGEDDGGINFYRKAGNCCVGSTGNIDNDPSDIVDIGDLTRLIDFLFISSTPLDCHLEADVDNDLANNIDIGDLTRLIDFLFISNSPLAICP